ncbi:hypothetical protein K6168_04885 [Streptomyces sp. FB2]|uniref:hypothetical protein n=1 Tax=Streptomyces sp. FB2 TaxID=2902454 RepID=UPI001F1C17D2|nr:hypothetical protein [Streptomyces sp. FB2]MCF2535012.1 hypothetical protein [Streptomyces sp. FB2]
MRQALTRGLIVAAAATSALSLYGTGASAAPRVHGTVVKSAVVLPGHAKASDPDGLNQLDDKLGAMDEQLDGVDKRIDDLELPGAAPEPAASGQGTASYGTDEPSGGSYGADEPTGDAGYGKEPGGYGYGSDEPSDEGPGYGDEPAEPTGPGYGYGDEPDEPTGHGYGYAYGEEPKSPEPEPTPTPTRPASPTPTPHEPRPEPSQTPPAGPERPHLPETGSGGIVGGIAASGALLIAGTALYRRNRAAARR